MRRRAIWTIGILVAATLLLIAGCAQDTEPGTEPGDAGPRDPVEVVITQGVDVQGWDIHDHNNTATEAVHTNVFDYLIWRGDDLEFEPALATSWELMDDFTWRFHLREGVTWHDGESFTAADVKFTLERIAHPETGEGLREHNQYRQIKEVRIMDDHTVDIVTHDREPVLLNRLCRLGSSMLPKHFFDRYDTLDEGFEAFENDPIGTGPYRVVEWIRDDRLIMEAFDDHWRGRAPIDRLVHRAIPEDSTRVAELITGGVQMAVNIPPMEWDRVDSEPGMAINRANSQRVMLIDIRHLEPFKTSDPRVREAIEYAIDNLALVDELLGGAATPTRTRVTPGNFGANPDLYDTYQFDPDHARALLADAGYGPDNPCEIGFLVPSGRYPMDREIGQAITGMLEDVGFVVELDILEWGAYTQTRSAAEQPEMTMIGLANSLWDAFLCFNGIRFSQDTNDRYGYVNDDYEDLIVAASTEMDSDRRRALYQEAGVIVAEDRPQIFLFQLMNNYGVADELLWEPRADEMLWMWAADIR